MARIHIIGAGLAGLAAGVKLAGRGQEVTLYEMAPQAGGRCRSFFDEKLGHTIDNGNHVILGANRHALDYIRAIGSLPAFIHSSRPSYAFMDMQSGERFMWRPPQPIPGARLREYRQFLSLMLARRGQTVAECVDSSSLLYRRLIEPFCISALNTVPEKASAALLRNVLWMVVKTGAAGMQYYLPSHSLSHSLIEPAIATLCAAGGRIELGCAVRSLEWSEGNVSALLCAGRRIEARGDSVILAASPAAAAKLLQDATVPTEYNAIVNGHFLCPGIAWPEGRDFLGVLGASVEWIFYRNGILSTTTSAANALASEDNNAIAARLWEDTCKALGLSLPLPACRIINEKRATHAATPAHYLKAKPRRVYGNLILAGDYTETSLPATIDAAVKSGFWAAEAVQKKACAVERK